MRKHWWSVSVFPNLLQDMVETQKEEAASKVFNQYSVYACDKMPNQRKARKE